MASVNKIFLMGNLTRDPELRYTPNGVPVCELGLAVNRKYTTNDQTREEVVFVDVVAWNKQAESCSKRLQKGSGIHLEGRLSMDSWEDKNGQKRIKHKITAEFVQFLSAKQRSQAPGETSQQVVAPPPHANAAVGDSDNIPF